MNSYNMKNKEIGLLTLILNVILFATFTGPIAFVCLVSIIFSPLTFVIFYYHKKAFEWSVNKMEIDNDNKTTDK